MKYKLIGSPARWNHQQMREAIGSRLFGYEKVENNVYIFSTFIKGIEIGDNNKWKLQFVEEPLLDDTTLFVSIKCLKKYCHEKHKEPLVFYLYNKKI